MEKVSSTGLESLEALSPGASTQLKSLAAPAVYVHISKNNKDIMKQTGQRQHLDLGCE